MRYSNEHSYATSHLEKEHSIFYNSIYSVDSYDNRVWALEKRTLDKILNKYYGGEQKIKDYLDFACGTGRICGFIESRAENSIGVDVSKEMLKIAKKKCLKTKLVLLDATKNNILNNKHFDLITSFRFFLNAEKKLKRKVLSEMSKMLKKDGILIVNIHGNRQSIRHLPFAIRNLFDNETFLSELTKNEFEKYLKEQNLVIKELYGLSFMPVFFAKILPYELWLFIEKSISRIKFINRYAIDLVLVITHEQEKIQN